ncbi:MAG: shikimate kinase [Acidobacteriota bacterium]|nr:MAG: shikimate kinase [Acidobacteriota bacterium]
MHREAAIFLLGFMACGKTTVGPVLAARLVREFIDLDRIIENQVGCTIGELIERDGEEEFRRIETRTLCEAAGSRAVIAPGGGAITREENREIMTSSGTTIWLDAPFDLCWKRILEDATVRPLAPDQNTARQRYDARLSLYSQADLRITIDERSSPDEIAGAIVNLIRSRD